MVMFMVVVVVMVMVIVMFVGSPVCAIIVTTIMVSPVCAIIMVMVMFMVVVVVMVMVIVMFVVVILSTCGTRAETLPVPAYLTITILARFTILATAPQGPASLCACALTPGLVVVEFGTNTRIMMVIVFIKNC